ncbi:alpha/beta fold hydrolase [Marinobacter subterrani]|uniref:alpha/beta fold hydrolase n=1 Tax=Marinobacter subterrani TaxID=1658765 RepID=UPI002355756A|nr:alpha/beta hydrolase [Marinobacter subterrani]
MNQSPKTTLILLPGMVCDHASWAPVIQGLEALADIRVADYGNHDQFTAMAESVLASAPGQFALAGHSMGGRVALEICRLAPERVERLCLIATEHTPKPDGEAGLNETRARQGMLDLARASGMQAMAEAWTPNLLASAHQNNDELNGRIINMIAAQPVARLQSHINAGDSRPDSTDVLRQLSCQVLLIAGAEDKLRPAAVMAHMTPLIANCQFETIPDCGHMPMMEQPDTVGQLLFRWMNAELNASQQQERL